MELPESFQRYKYAVGKIEEFCLKQATEAIVDGRQTPLMVEYISSTLIQGFREITHALERLELLENLFNTPAPNSDRISKNTYLNFLIGAHLQEVYILEQRLGTYAKKVSRAYKNNFNGEELAALVRGRLDQTIKVRGEHVHSRRFEDRRLDFISGLTLLGELAEQLGLSAETKYAEVQLEWAVKTRVANSEVSAVIEEYFKSIHSAITNDAGIILPGAGPGLGAQSIALDI